MILRTAVLCQYLWAILRVDATVGRKRRVEMSGDVPNRPLSTEVGRRFKALREARGLRREAVALALDTGSENWRCYETGKYHLPAELLPVLAPVFRLSLPQLAELLLSRDVPAWARPPADTDGHDQARREQKSSLALRLDWRQLAPALCSA